MNYNLLGNLTAFVHITTVVLLVAGILISIRYKRFRPWESLALVAVVILWSVYGNCPLTILEEHFRVLAGTPSYITSVGFLPFYANKLMGVSLMSSTVVRSTYFFGGMLTLGSIEWLSPYLNMELFKLRKLLGIKHGKPAVHKKLARSRS